MIEWLLHNWEGYVRLRLHGYSPERFLNLCNARGLEVWGLICNRDGDYEFFLTVEALVLRCRNHGLFPGALRHVPVYLGYPV